MSDATLTSHALVRMAQRAISGDDLDLVRTFGTEVEGGYLLRAKDCQAIEHAVKRFVDRVRRLSGERVVVAGGRVVTAYHARRSKQCRLLRRAERRGALE